MQRKIRSKLETLLKRGDTIIEVTIAITVFSLISIISIQVMDRDIAIIQGTLESEMARNEIDAQAEALRFIQNAYLSERELATKDRQYQGLWMKLSRDPTVVISTDRNAGTGLANEPKNISEYYSTQCSDYYNKSKTGSLHNIFADRAFVMNTRKIDPTDISGTIVQTKNSPNKFKETQLYPRIVYTGGTSAGSIKSDANVLSESFPNGASDPTKQMQSSSAKIYDKVASAEGIWVIAAKAETKGSKKSPEFYDFHIRTCWFAPGHDRPSTIATTIRLYNPEYIEDQR